MDENETDDVQKFVGRGRIMGKVIKLGRVLDFLPLMG